MEWCSTVLLRKYPGLRIMRRSCWTEKWNGSLNEKSDTSQTLGIALMTIFLLSAKSAQKTYFCSKTCRMMPAPVFLIPFSYTCILLRHQQSTTVYFSAWHTVMPDPTNIYRTHKFWLSVNLHWSNSFYQMPFLKLGCRTWTSLLRKHIRTFDFTHGRLSRKTCCCETVISKLTRSAPMFTCDTHFFAVIRECCDLPVLSEHCHINPPLQWFQ